MVKTEKFLRFEENPEKIRGKNPGKIRKKWFNFKFKKQAINCVKKYGQN